jgi:spore cortex protein
LTARQSKRKGNDNNTITALNRKNDLRAFISNSTPGLQFSLIVLYSIARKYYGSQSDHIRKNDTRKTNGNVVFTFSSREFRDAYSRTAFDLGLTEHLIREIAFPEYTLTLLYLGFIREKEDAGEYEFRLSLNESKWLASIALNIIQGRIRSPAERNEVNYGTSLTSNPDAEGLVKEITFDTLSSIPTPAYMYASSSDKLKDRRRLVARPEKLVTPRSRNYGKLRMSSYLQDKQPPSTYKLRKNLSTGESKIVQDNFANKACIVCGRKILFEDFDIWIGEPMKRTPSNVQDQRMSDIFSTSTTKLRREYTANPNNNNNNNNNAYPNSNNNYGYPNGNDNITNMTDRNNNVTNMTDRNNNGDNNQNRLAVADKAAEKVVSMREVDQANVIVTDNNAYVAAKLANPNGNQLEKDVENKISDVVKSTDSDIDHVYVSVNPDFYERTTSYANDIRNGRPVAGFFDEFNTLVRRIFPTER